MWPERLNFLYFPSSFLLSEFTRCRNGQTRIDTPEKLLNSLTRVKNWFGQDNSDNRKSVLPWYIWEWAMRIKRSFPFMIKIISDSPGIDPLFPSWKLYGFFRYFFPGSARLQSDPLKMSGPLLANVIWDSSFFVFPSTFSLSKYYRALHISVERIFTNFLDFPKF